MSFKKLRKSSNMTQADVADAIGITRAAYTNIENGKREADYATLNKLAEIFHCTTDILLNRPKGVKIPVLGYVRAGIPMEAIEEILDYEEITEQMAANGEYFALQIRGDSMEPKFVEGDVVIVRKQPSVDNCDIAVVLVNGDDATIKQLVRHKDGVNLVAINSKYAPLYFSNDEILELPLSVLGKVVELRRKF